MILSPEQREKIIALFPDDCDRLLNLDNLNDMIDFLDDEIFGLLDENYEPTDASILVERLRDEIYWDNTHKG